MKQETKNKLKEYTFTGAASSVIAIIAIALCFASTQIFFPQKDKTTCIEAVEQIVLEKFDIEMELYHAQAERNMMELDLDSAHMGLFLWQSGIVRYQQSDSYYDNNSIDHQIWQSLTMECYPHYAEEKLKQLSEEEEYAVLYEKVKDALRIKSSNPKPKVK